MSCKSETLDPTCLQQRALRTLEEQQKILSSKLKASADPQPGDGVCPTSKQYHNTATKSRELWHTLIADATRNPAVPNIAEQLVDLLRDVPAFPVTLSRQFSTLESYCLEVECVSEWLTTTDLECDQRFKTIRHYQTLGIPKPVMYQLIDACDIQPVSQIDDDKSIFLLLVLAWSYIMSSRWVEALQCTGANAQLLQGGEVNTQSFWTLIRKQQWRAILTHGGETYFAPWSLAESEEKLSDQAVLASPATSFALKMLADFCATEEIYEQSIIALVVVMMLPARAYKETVLIPKYSLLSNIGSMDFTASKLSFRVLSSLLDSCITLSCCPEGIDSLLCSVFFDPGVSCNLIGAQMTGTMEALLSIQNDDRILLSLMTRRCPKLAPLWAAAICIRQVQRIFRKAAGGTPPLGLPAASWTGIVESFIQVRYISNNLLASEILRTEEWRHTYLITAERLPPDSPSPPFGKTDIRNVNTNVRMHLGHDHRLLSYQMYWILKSGQKFPAQASSVNLHLIDFALEIARPTSSNTAVCISPIDNVQKSSCNATFSIFNWLRNVEEGGLWPRAGSDSSSDVRAVMRHRWITDEDTDLSDEGASNDTDQHNPDLIRIQEWLEGCRPFMAQWMDPSTELRNR